MVAPEENVPTTRWNEIAAATKLSLGVDGMRSLSGNMFLCFSFLKRPPAATVVNFSRLAGAQLADAAVRGPAGELHGRAHFLLRRLSERRSFLGLSLVYLARGYVVER